MVVEGWAPGLVLFLAYRPAMPLIQCPPRELPMILVKVFCHLRKQCLLPRIDENIAVMSLCRMERG